VRTLVLGGVRSGKSRYAEALARNAAGSITLIATGTAGDAEMAGRIAAHRASRPAHWSVIEEPLRLASTLSLAATPNSLIIVDCLTLWLTNLLCHTDAGLLETEVESLVTALPELSGTQILVANEVGLGIIPTYALGRRFADAAGVLHQRLAGACDRVVFMIAGLPLTVKDRSISERGDSRMAR
jgi:adenosylcobinamide kinase/adenosylcobinamide-phosphate guanylyltransferase